MMKSFKLINLPALCVNGLAVGVGDVVDLDIDAQPEWCASRKAIARGDLVPFVDASADTAPPARKPRGSKGGTLAITAQPDEAPEVEPEGFPLLEG